MTDKKEPDHRLPEWAPKGAGNAFATRVVKGEVCHNKPMQDIKHREHRNSIDIEYLYRGIIERNVTILSKAITLIESNSHKHFDSAQELITKLLPHSGNSIRIGITGVPGAGKSTFIETLGTWLIEQKHRVAVLAIDPSSTISKGSILGDKTRMEKLSRSQDSFIRPSPSSGVLGGVARKTRETIIACEAAGFDVILIETVGVGQSEVTVRSIVDFFLLLQITGAGDDLQGIKKGIMELADLVVVNKADGDNKLHAETTCNELNQVLHYLQPATGHWITKALTCSAQTGYNVPQIWEIISRFRKETTENGILCQRRSTQNLEWLNTMLAEELNQMFFTNKAINEAYQKSKSEILNGSLTPANAVSKLIKLFKLQQ